MTLRMIYINFAYLLTYVMSVGNTLVLSVTACLVPSSMSTLVKITWAVSITFSKRSETQMVIAYIVSVKYSEWANP